MHHSKENWGARGLADIFFLFRKSSKLDECSTPFPCLTKKRKQHYITRLQCLNFFATLACLHCNFSGKERDRCWNISLQSMIPICKASAHSHFTVTFVVLPLEVVPALSDSFGAFTPFFRVDHLVEYQVFITGKPLFKIILYLLEK